MNLDSFLAKMAEQPSIILKIPVDNNGVVSYEDLPLAVSDDSYRYRAIMGEHTLNLKFSLPGYKEIPIGTYCEYQSLTYTLEVPENIKKNGVSDFQYDLVLQSDQYKLTKFMLRNIVPGDSRLKFSYTARPEEFLRLIVENMNKRDSGWSFDPDHVESNERVVSFNHNTCADAIQMIAEAFETEWEVKGKIISLRKVEYNKDNPLPLSYGKGNGFLPGLGRSEYSDVKPVERLFVQGGDRNIDANSYRRNEGTGQIGSRELLLPANRRIKFDGSHFDDEDGFDSDSPNVREYISDADGLSVCRYENRNRENLLEGSLDASEIYPMREGIIESVIPVDPSKNFYDFTDADPNIPNYTNHLIAGETMTAIFQTGMMTGKEFDVAYKHPGHFEIVPQIIDGVDMPGGSFLPSAGDKYGVFHVMLPNEYIQDAELNMLKQSIRYLYDNETPRFTFTGTLDGIWAKRDWVNIGGRISLGGFIRFTDSQFLPEGMDIRITGVKDYVNNPHRPEIELSNNSQSGSWIHNMQRRIESDEVAVDSKDRNVIQFAKRRFRDVRETMSMLESSMLNFTGGINPVTVNTMLLLVGEDGLQFDYSEPADTFRFEPSDGKTFHANAGVITHKTISSSSGVRMSWNMPAFRSATLDDSSKGYFVYAKVNKGGGTGVFMLSETALAMNGDSTHYYLLVGILNSEFDGDRSFAQMYGYTEILPGRITTDRIVSSDGNSFFDLVANAFKAGNIDWNSTQANTLTIKGALNVINALIAGFTFSNLLIQSTKKVGTESALSLDGNNGKIQLISQVPNMQEAGGTVNVRQAINIDAVAGTVSSEDSNNSAARLNSQGIFANKAGISATADSMGAKIVASIVGLGQGKLNKDEWSDYDGVVGVYGSAVNSSANPSPAYGGWFEKLRVNGLYLNSRQVSANTTLTQSDVFIGCFTSSVITITLPSNPYPGQTILIRQVYASGFIINGNGKQIISNGNPASSISNSGVRGSISMLVYSNDSIGFTGSFWLYNNIGV